MPRRRRPSGAIAREEELDDDLHGTFLIYLVKLLRRFGQSAQELHPRYWTAASARTRLIHRLSVALHTERWAPVHRAYQEGAQNRSRMEDFCMPAQAVPAG